ncbi:MAG: carbohydrate-binding domain-containing protein, partial [Clostridiaceae bacterium]|nr:carbohydrate-binding domain-containing protein [Clostridiaceae bacterium]
MKRILILVLCLAFLWTILPMEIKAESSSPPEGSCISPSLSIEVSNITEREATLSFTANTDGTIYYLLQEAGAKTPEETALLTGATLSLTADIESAVPLEGLIPQTDYSVYALFNDSMEGQSAMGTTAFATQTATLAKGTVLPMASSPNDYIFDISEGPITINKADGAGMLTVSYGNPTQTTAPFANSQYITITGTSTSNGIKIDELLKTGTNIILKDVNIDQSSNNESAFNMNGANVNLTLIGTNSLKSGIKRAGLGAPDGSTLIIDGSGSLEATGKDFGAGIGGGLRQNGGTIKVTGGTIIATGGIEAAGIGGGDGGSGGSAVITGGSVKASGGSHDIQGIPTNGETNGSLLLRLAEFELSGCPQGTQISDLTITGAPYYGTKDFFVDSKSKLYLWLPAEASALCAKISEDEYYNIPVVFSTNAEKPEIFSLTPSGTGAALSGDLVITFNMQMRSGAGTVFLNGSALTGGVWDENLTVFTIPYSGLPYSKACVIKVSGFKNFWGDVMDDDEGHSFFTKAAPVSFPAVTTDPAISEITDSEATISGRVTSDGGATVSERGFVFSTTANPRINGLGVT